MGRIKKKASKPWCWYCDREFEDDKVLARHQKAKHFKCSQCNKSLYSGPGLVTHTMQVHKTQLTKILNALPGRDDASIEIYGTEGIPPEDLKAHQMKKNPKLALDDDEDEVSPPKQAKTSQPTPNCLPNMGMMHPGMPPFGGPFPMQPYMCPPQWAHAMPPMVPPHPYGYPPMNINPIPTVPPLTRTPPPTTMLFPSAVATVVNENRSDLPDVKAHDDSVDETTEHDDTILAKDLTDNSRLMYSLEDVSPEEYRARQYAKKEKSEESGGSSIQNKTATVTVAPQIFSAPPAFPFPGNQPFNYAVPPMMRPPFVQGLGMPPLPLPPMGQFGFMPPTDHRAFQNR